ncbi:MAG: hypothetical protein LBP59_05600 [Planctomycetaceae bacterium]|nr:hypothetical protein [Planctomycetaceae bacterium]
MSITACRRDACDPSDDFLLQKIFTVIPNSKFKKYFLTAKIYRLNFRERLRVNGCE